MPLVVSIVSSFLAALLAPISIKRFPTAAPIAICAFGLSLSAYFLSLLPSVLKMSGPENRAPWVPHLGLEFAFRVDGLTILFLLLVSCLGTLIAIYSIGYLKNHPRLGSFYGYLLFFMGSMLGLVAADDLILLFIFWELTSISSFLLIGFDHERGQSRKAALQALLVTGGGGLALLAGFVLLGEIHGGYRISEIVLDHDAIRGHELYPACLCLILLGALTKSAQVPFHFWLPNAMVAPTPVSAYLHSATMVKAGIYLVARLHPTLGGTELWQWILIPIGTLTAVLGPVMALEQTDLKKLLAYSTVGTLGMLMLLFGIGSENAINAAIVYLLVHALYKGALFMVAGAVDHGTGTRDVRGLYGLRKRMPITSMAAMLAALSMAGFPPLFGFIGKELAYEAKLAAPNVGWILFGFSIVANIFTVAIAFMVGLEPFMGRSIKSPRPPHEVPATLWIGPLTLALAGLLIGLDPGRTVQPLLSAATNVILARQHELSLKVWHGFNIVFVFSILTLCGGLVVFLLRNHIRPLMERLATLGRFGPDAIYDRALSSFVRGANLVTNLVQSGHLSRYIMILLAAVVALLGSTLWEARETLPQTDSGTLYWHEAVLVTMVIVAAITAAVHPSKILLIACMTIVGFGIAILYVLFGAPDLAITQILVEVLSVVLTVFLVSRLPMLKNRLHPLPRALRVSLACAVGSIMGYLTALALDVQPLGKRVSEFYVTNGLSAARGTNIVNVILVDFRALDTLGEITVLGVAAVGVISLLTMPTSAGARK